MSLNCLLSDGYDAATQSHVVTSEPYKYCTVCLIDWFLVIYQSYVAQQFQLKWCCVMSPLHSTVFLQVSAVNFGLCHKNILTN